MKRAKYKISVIGYGNLAYRLTMAFRLADITIDYIYGRDIDEASKLAYILNKPENSYSKKQQLVKATLNLGMLAKSDIVILAVTDRSISDVAGLIIKTPEFKKSKPSIIHCSGACPLSLLDGFQESGVLYPLMTLSKTKPVDFSLVPFFIEFSGDKTEIFLKDICYRLKSEYRVTESEERLKLHTAAVYVSNFINYLTGLAFDISKPNQMFLMPLAIESIRKAFLYEHPSLVQTGPAIRGDMDTVEKHRELLKDKLEHKAVYEMLSGFISQKRKLF